jgi:type II secretory pathway component GspD/PulD (secretin)
MRKICAFLACFLLVCAAAFGQACEPELKILKISHGSSQAILEVAESLKSSQGRVSFDGNTGSLIVFDCPGNIERIAKVVRELDVREKQVEIKVLVVEAQEKFLRDIGITSARVIIPKGEFSAIADLIDKNKEARTRTSMMVRTLSNNPAVLQVTTDEVIGTELVIFSNGTEIVTPVTAPIGSLLEVLPTVNNDGTIMVVLRPSVSSMERSGNPSERSIITQVLINDGDTIAIGGADSERSSSSSSCPMSKRSLEKKKKVEMFLTATTVD